MDRPPVNVVDVSLAEIEPPPWVERCERFCLAVLDRLELRGWELSVLLCSDTFMRGLNRRYRGIDAPTDVLSFGQEGDASEGGGQGASAVPSAELPETRSVSSTRSVSGLRPVGDLVISPETLARNAAEAGVPADEELKRLVIHGILHLNGMDHPEGDSRMLRLQEELVAAFREERVI